VLLAGLFSTVLVGRTPSVPRMLAAVAAGQLTFHTVFTTLGNSGGVALVPSPHTGHAGHGTLIAEAAAHPAAEHSGPWMLLAHVVAGLASALLLAYSERALKALRRVALFTLHRLTGAPAPLALPRLRPVEIAVARVAARWMCVLGSLRYRGPPALLRAA
jgi:hypothetical protein